MTQYISRRLLLIFPTVLGAVIVIYVIMNILPGDIVLLVLGGEAEGGRGSPEMLAAIRSELGLDQPIYTRFFSWLWNLFQLDLGNSLYSGVPVTSLIWVRLPVSFTLMIGAVIVSMSVSIPLGIIMALKRDSWIDYGLRIILIAGISMPSFWVAIIVVMILLIYFGWLPPISYATIFTDPWVSIQQLIFPILVLGYRPAAIQARLLRSMMLEVMGEDYIRTARAKGLPERVVIFLHVLKNALLPVVTLIGMEAALLISATVIVELVFSVPGVGSMLVASIERRDIPLVQGIIFLVVVVVVMFNLVVDITYSFLDPRIRYGRRA